MRWFKHNLDSLNILKIVGRRFVVVSRTSIFFILLIPLFLINCEKELKKLVAPDESEFPGSPINVKVVVDDRSIIISWQMSDTTGIHCYHIYRADSMDTKKELLDSSFVRRYVDDNVINGNIYYYHIVAVNNKGYEGNQSEDVSARSNLFNLLIENGDEYTNKRSVNLKLTVPIGTRLMLIGNDSAFTNSSWEYFVSTKNWTLSQGDGLKYVYARFRDSEGNENKSSIHDTIILDTQATISSVYENTNGQVKKPGEMIHFKVIAGESDGKATIDVGTQKPGIKLFDDGAHGDLTANDGTYEVDYQVPADLEVVNAPITGHFTDRANNVASDVTASGRVTIQRPPSAVILSDPAVVGKSLELMWSQNQDEDFKSYRLFRSTSPGVTINDKLLATQTNRTETSFTDTDVREDSTYYYFVVVYDNFGLWTGSNEVDGAINMNEAPTPVNLLQPTPIANSTTSLHLSWTMNEDKDFASYKIFESKSPGVDSSDHLVTTITNQNTTDYDDSNLQPDTEYYYKVYVYDTGGKSAGSNEEKGKTSANEPPLAVTLYPPSPIANSATSLNISWSKNEDSDFASYKVYRSDSAGVSNTNSSLVNTITQQGTTTLDDIDLKEDTEYYYQVYVYDEGGLFAASNEEKGRTTNNPPTPVELSKPEVIDSVTLKLTWTKNIDDDFKMYKIYRSETSPLSEEDSLIATIYEKGTTEYEDTGLVPNKTYYYRVYVADKGGLTSESDEVSGIPKP